MTQDHSLPVEEIRNENITAELVAEYAEKGYTLTFAEEVMRYDLSRAIPHVAVPTNISYCNWEPDRTHDFFAVYEAAFRDRPGFPNWSEEKWVHATTEDESFRPDLSYLALVQGQVAGFLTSDEEGTTGWVSQIGVHPTWRRLGVGAALLTRALHAWKKEGKEAVLLHVNINNPGAIRLYQQLGFVIIKRRGKFQKQDLD